MNTATTPKKEDDAAPPVPPIVYRNAAGQILPDEDMRLRQALGLAMARLASRRLEYDGTFRAGTITYVEGALRIPFSHEMGGGACKFYIDVPPAALWEADTGVPIARRDEILRFLAETVQRERASSWRFEIEGDAIGYY
nr:hypothetical protein [uncultured Roseateles sp.]